jgi:protein-tyrosine phosphatase
MVIGRGGLWPVLRRGAARAYRNARNLGDRVLHPRRHRRALAQVRAIDGLASMLVVCHGNICRSPYLAAVLQDALPGVDVSSAGFVGAGRPVPEHSGLIAARRGLDLSSHRSRLVTRDLVDQSDLFLVMDARQAEFLARGFGVVRTRIIITGDLDPDPREPRAIRDPWRQSLEVFEQSFSRLDRCAVNLVTQLTKSRANTSRR